MITVNPASQAGNPVFIYDLSSQLSYTETTADAGYDTELADLQTQFDDWYGILIDSSSVANNTDVAAFALSSDSPKLFFMNSANAADAAGSGLIQTLEGQSNKRVFALYHPYPDEYPAAVAAGYLLANTPGSVNMNAKALPGVTATTPSDTVVNNVLADSGNIYITVGGIGWLREGRATSGAWIEEVHGTDALIARMQEAAARVLANAQKIGYNQKGFNVIGQAIKAAMTAFEGEQDALLLPESSEVQMPQADLALPADRAARHIRGIKAFATFLGSANTLEIELSLV